MKLGELSHSREVGLKDAVHMAIVTVTANEYISVGQPVRFLDSNMDTVGPCEYKEDYKHGIADPFYSGNGFHTGEAFVVLLIPGSAGNLRHEFDLKFEDLPEPEYWGDDECRFCD